MDYKIIKQDRSSDSEGFMRGLDPFGVDPADLKPDPVDAPDILGIVQKAQIAASPRVTIDPAFLNAPDMDSDVDEDGALDPMMKITTIEPGYGLTALEKHLGIDLLKSPSNTLKKKLGIATTTIRKDETGTRWLRGFSADGTLIDCRVLIGSEDE